MGISHAKVDGVADWTGTVTVYNSTGGQTTVAATDMVRPSDWNSAHNQQYFFAGNTLGASTVSGSDVYWAGGTNISLSVNGSTVSVNGPDIQSRYRFPILPLWPNVGFLSQISGTTGATGGSSQTTASYRMAPLDVQNPVDINDVEFVASFNTVAGTGGGRQAHMFGLYTIDPSMSRFSLFTSWAWNWSLTQNSITAQSHSFWWGTNSTLAANSYGLTNSSVSCTGLKRMDLYDGATVIPPDNYFLVYCNTASSNASNVVSGVSLGIYSNSGANTTIGGYMGKATNSTAPVVDGFGVFSSTSNGTSAHYYILPASIHTSAITNTGGSSQQIQPYFYMYKTINHA